MNNKQIITGFGFAAVAAFISYSLGYRPGAEASFGPLSFPATAVTILAGAGGFLAPKVVQGVVDIDLPDFDWVSETEEGTLGNAMEHIEALDRLVGDNPEAKKKLKELFPIIYDKCRAGGESDA